MVKLKFSGGPYDGACIEKKSAPQVFVWGTNATYARHTYVLDTSDAGLHLYKYHGQATTRTIQALDKKYGGAK